MTTGTAVAPVAGLSAANAAVLPADSVVAALRSDALAGLASPEAARRLAALGPNALRNHRARAVGVLLRQLKSRCWCSYRWPWRPAFAVGERTDAGMIAAILAASQHRARLRQRVPRRARQRGTARTRSPRCRRRTRQHTAPDPRRRPVPGDVVQLGIGTVVPVDLRLLDAAGLACDENVLTGESLPAAKQIARGRGERVRRRHRHQELAARGVPVLRRASRAGRACAHV